MTIVNTQTGEITESMDKAAARRITDRIRLLAEGVAEQVEKMAGLINDARIGSAWLALGYQSWTAYVAEEFGGVLPRLDREPRQEFVRELRIRSGLGVQELADQVAVKRPYIAKIELGHSRRVSPKVYNALLVALSITDRRVLLANPHGTEAAAA